MKNERWDLPSLVGALSTAPAALAAGVTVEMPDDVGHAAVIALESEPGLKMVMGIDGGEVQFSVLLEPVAKVGRQADFDRALLRANKLMSLSTFGITDMGGEEWYEIFGQMSSASGLEEIVEEIVALGKNAEEALELVVEWEGPASADGQQRV